MVRWSLVHVAGLYDLYTKYYSVGTSSSNNIFHNQTKSMAFGIFTYNHNIVVFLMVFMQVNTPALMDPAFFRPDSPGLPWLAQLDILYADLTGSEIPFTVWVLGWNIHTWVKLGCKHSYTPRRFCASLQLKQSVYPMSQLEPCVVYLPTFTLSI